ncbi:phage antirepressor KilAC domain-containing protein [Campylobacter curvus]|uniref:phage antirepressor KilAC domain-containing protein n=1 Tax=Campylobacter curvus TaxID=200 RepID=UPI00146FF191|nr:phage antirepressor KilAC domain-containing protein [Campylobacter curvus]
MNPIEIFKNKEFEIRGGLVNDAPMFCLADVCRALGLTTPAKVSEAIRTEFELGELNSYSFDTGYGVKALTMITEPQLYFVLMRSTKPIAKKFRLWVNQEVLPSIRKHGAYMTPETIKEALLNPDTIIRIATALKQEQEQNRQLRAQIEADKEYVALGKSINTSAGSILIGDYAKYLSSCEGVTIGGHRLFKWLRKEGYLIKGGARHNMPYQKYIDNGYFEVKARTFNAASTLYQCFTTKITGKGQTALASKILASFRGGA